MEVWIVIEDYDGGAQVVAVFAHPPTEDEVAQLGPAPDYARRATRLVEHWEVRE